MFSQSLQDALNEQIKNEFYSAYMYLAMSSWFEDKALPGFAKWMRVQYQEELTHGLKIFDFILDRDARALVHGFNAPPAEWKSSLDAFESSYAHEQKVTAMINNLYALAVKENDYPTIVLLQWFINEQVEEEKSVKLIVDQLRMAGDSATALLLLDRELGARAA
ncbi:MAG: Bacterial non-heme ferritin [Anaerolineae bacterium]|nr:Bacterial non-heme ferritin [Anaerolineae bacterium]RIK18256.1 MAG: ferritin [Chloroflexota bacterium]